MLMAVRSVSISGEQLLTTEINRLTGVVVRVHVVKVVALLIAYKILLNVVDCLLAYVPF